MTHARIPNFAAPPPLPVSTLFPVPMPTDPVLAAIETHNEAWAVFQVAPGGRPSGVAEDALHLAFENLLAMPCLTRVGALALVRHLRWIIREEAISPECDDVLGRLALAREADLSRFVGSDLPPEYLPTAAPLGRLAAQVVHHLPPLPPATARHPAPRSLSRMASVAGEVLAAVAIIGGGILLTGLATLL